MLRGRRAEVGRGMRQGQIATRRQCIPEHGEDAGRVLVFGDEVQDRHQEQRDGPAAVDQGADLRVGHDGFRFAQVGQHDAGGPAAGWAATSGIR